MFRLRMRLVHLLLLAMLGLLALPLAASAQGNSQNARLCTNGGYLDYMNADGQVFANEGECVQYAAQGNPLVTEDPAVTRCKQEAAAAGITPEGFNIIVGTEGNDSFTPTDGPDLICGFGGNDMVDYYQPLGADDVFLGGDGNDTVHEVYGVFNGDAGDDYGVLVYGTFNGGAGNDSGGAVFGIFNGGDGNDHAQQIRESGTFNGGAGDDTNLWSIGTFNGGDGIDSGCNWQDRGTFDSVEVDTCSQL